MRNATLYVVATPIGNLDDLSPRARQVLGTVDLIAAEDTRRSGQLLSKFAISTPMVALHEHNEAAQIGALIGRLAEGGSIALISDAGTPLVSDPGYRLVQAAHEQGIKVSPIPGASAALAALSVAGLPTDRFTFEGFLPAKQQGRKSRLQDLRDEPRTMIFFESVHRIVESVADLASELGGERRAFIGRELTKLHEQCVRGTLDEIARLLQAGDIARRGEFVVLVEGSTDEPDAALLIDAERLLVELCKVLPGKQAVDIVSSLGGGRRNELYERMLALKEEGG